MSRLGLLLRGIVVALCALVLVAGLLIDRFEGGWVGVLETLLSYQCHRIPDRTLVLFGAPMAICSRCAGLYLGVLLGTLLAWPRWHHRRTAVIALSFLAVMIVEVALEGLGVLRPFHALRATLGIAFAWPIAAAAARLVSGTLQPRPT